MIAPTMPAPSPQAPATSSGRAPRGVSAASLQPLTAAIADGAAAKIEVLGGNRGLARGTYDAAIVRDGRCRRAGHDGIELQAVVGGCLGMRNTGVVGHASPLG